MLPDSFRWLDSPGASYLHYNAKNIASVHADRLEVRWTGRAVTARCGSVEQGKRYVERWMAARLRVGGTLRRGE